MKTLEQLTIPEKKGLAILILREEFEFKWIVVSAIMAIPPTTCKRLYKKFQHIYAPSN